MNNYPVHRQRNLIIIMTLLGLVGLLFFAYVNSAKELILEVNEDIYEIKSFAVTVEELLAKEDIQIHEKGYINYPLDKSLEDKMHLIIKDPKTYNIEIGEELREGELSPYQKVSEILADLNVEVGALDYSEPGLDESVEDGSTIKFFKVREEIESREEKLPYKEIINKNKDLESGKTQVVQKGEEGREKLQIKNRFVNGELVETTTIDKELVKEPVDQIVERGTKVLVASRGAGPKPSRGDLKGGVVMTATAYDLSFASCGKRPGDRGYGKTATGTQARPGAIAVDPRVIPLGSKLYIESLDGSPDYGYATAEDTGGAIKGKKVDLFFHTAAEVRNYGRRQVKVYVLD